ncbi:MAG: glycosyltransferase family 4 protein [Planctomycetes bacterium]|nr:glycosyltransferase family 4 protein [Planctomycetota bacterium]
MRLLILTNNPERASFRQRIQIYFDTLRTNGIDYQVAKLPAGFLARRKLFKRTADFDGVLLHKKGFNPFDAFWLSRYSKRLIYHFDDAIMYSTKHPDRKSSSHFRPFRRTAKLANMVIAGNSYLAEHARKFNSRVEVLPTGLNTKEYMVDTRGENDGKIRLVWIGSSSTLKYLAEIKPAIEEICSRFDNVILRIIADEFFDLQNMEVEKRQWSLEKQAIDLATSDIGLAPLPDNRFTRGKCGFKILQYAAVGLPVVASPVGVNAEYVCDGVSGFLAESNAEWIDKITRLVEDSQLRKTMGDNNLTLAKNFDINIIGKRLADLITECVGKVSS